MRTSTQTRMGRSSQPKLGPCGRPASGNNGSRNTLGFAWCMELLEPDRSLWEDLVGSDAVGRLHDLVDGTRTCLFMVLGPGAGTGARPMHVLEVDARGSLWFFSARSSGKNAAIANDRRVELFFANVDRAEYMVVLGHAHIHLDRARIKELWTPSLLPWFPHGTDDNGASLIEVVPTHIQYWMPESGKLVSMIKSLRAAVTGSTPATGKRGRLRI